MWHEARKHEKKLRGMMVDYRRRAERRREFYESIRRDPASYLQIHGQQMRIHIDPAISQAADACLMPWMGDASNMIDRFDVRAHLHSIPSATDVPTHSSSSGPEYKLSAAEESQLNYERYRNLVQNDFLSITESKYLSQIFDEERSVQMQNSALKQKSQAELKKKLAEKKAAIGFNYDEIEGKGSRNTANDSEEDSADSEDEEEEEEEFQDLDTTVHIDQLNEEMRARICLLAATFGVKNKLFLKYLTTDKEEAEKLRIAKEIETEKSVFAGRRSRRERKELKQQRMLILRSINTEDGDDNSFGRHEETNRNGEESSEEDDDEDDANKSDIDESKVEFITCFGKSSSSEDESPAPKVDPKKDKQKSGKHDKKGKKGKNQHDKPKLSRDGTRGSIDHQPQGPALPLFGPTLPSQAKESPFSTSRDIKFASSSDKSRSRHYRSRRSDDEKASPPITAPARERTPIKDIYRRGGRRSRSSSSASSVSSVERRRRRLLGDSPKRRPRSISKSPERSNRRTSTTKSSRHRFSSSSRSRSRSRSRGRGGGASKYRSNNSRRRSPHSRDRSPPARHRRASPPKRKSDSRSRRSHSSSLPRRYRRNSRSRSRGSPDRNKRKTAEVRKSPPRRGDDRRRSSPDRRDRGRSRSYNRRDTRRRSRSPESPRHRTTNRNSKERSKKDASRETNRKASENTRQTSRPKSPEIVKRKSPSPVIVKKFETMKAIEVESIIPSLASQLPTPEISVSTSTVAPKVDPPIKKYYRHDLADEKDDFGPDSSEDEHPDSSSKRSHVPSSSLSSTQQITQPAQSKSNLTSDSLVGRVPEATTTSATVTRNGNGSSVPGIPITSSSSITTTPSLITPQERLRRLMQAQLDKEYKRDKQAAAEKLEKQKLEKLERDEELHKMTSKLNERRYQRGGQSRSRSSSRSSSRSQRSASSASSASSHSSHSSASSSSSSSAFSDFDSPGFSARGRGGGGGGRRGRTIKRSRSPSPSRRSSGFKRQSRSPAKRGSRPSTGGGRSDGGISSYRSKRSSRS